MKTALVLGAGGFIGSHLVKKLINLGYCNMHSTIKITSWDKVFYYFKNSFEGKF